MRDDSVLDRRGPRLEDISMSGVWLRRSATCSLKWLSASRDSFVVATPRLPR